MAKAAAKRGKNKDNARRSKKKTSILTTERVEYAEQVVDAEVANEPALEPRDGRS